MNETELLHGVVWALRGPSAPVGALAPLLEELGLEVIAAGATVSVRGPEAAFLRAFGRLPASVDPTEGMCGLRLDVRLEGRVSALTAPSQGVPFG